MTDENPAKKGSNSSIRLGLFKRRLAEGATAYKFSVYNYLTFKNIVMGLAASTFLIFLGFAVSIQIAFLSAALMGLLWLILLEMHSRRKWEHSLLGQLQRMNNDYERIVRETARNRNDTGMLRKK